MNSRPRINVAYFCVPQIGGTFTFFRKLRPILESLDINFRCVSPISIEKFKGTRFEGAEGVDFISLSDDLATATRQLNEHLLQNNYKFVMVLPAADVLSSNLPCYLPRSIRCGMRVPMMTRGAYAPAKAVAGHLNMIYAVSDRIADDLTGSYGISREQLEIIYHGVDPVPFNDVLDRKKSGSTIKLLYAGRLWDIDKGVFLLPPMMRSLIRLGKDVHLTVAGDGEDGPELQRRFQKAGVAARVDMTGPVPLEKMNGLFENADCFIFPSRFEGCGFAVLEAMAAGCAPVVADIRGSLRVLVNDGQCGQLARVGDAGDFARAVAELVDNRDKLKEMQSAARARVLERFTLDRMAADYARSFRRLLECPDLRVPPDSIDHYKVPAAFKPTWRTLIPRPVKNLARTWLERMGISS